MKVKRNYRYVQANTLHYKVFTKEDNTPMDCYGYEGEDGEWCRVFVKHHSYRYLTKEMRAGSVPFDEVMSKVKEVLSAERTKAEHVVEMLRAEETEEYKKTLYKDNIEKLRVIFYKMDAIVQERCRLSTDRLRGNNTEPDYEDRMEKLWSYEEALEKEFSSIEDGINNIESYFGMKNSWLRKYLHFDPDKEITRDIVKKMIDKVLIDEDKNIEVFLLDTDGKKFFPKEWFEERSVA